MNRDETTAFLRTRRELTGATYNGDTIDAWAEALAGRGFDECRRALIRATLDGGKRITVAHIVDHLPALAPDRPQREDPICIRCGLLPAERLRTRCDFCQGLVDDEVAEGIHNPAMAAAIQAARDLQQRRGPSNFRLRPDPDAEPEPAP